MPTPQELIDLSIQLTDIVKSINAIVATQHLPFDAETMNLSNTAFLLAAQANAIGQGGLAALARDVQGAISQLTTQVASANAALARIRDLKKALNIVDVVLNGAASIATSAATGNWIGTASDIITFASNLQTAIASNPN
jgi:hypothetical protein